MHITRILTSLVFGVLLATHVAAQEPVNPEQVNQPPTKKELLPYEKYPELPAFNILMTDSMVFNTYFIKKGKPTVLMLFGIDCDHCQAFTQALCRDNDLLKNVNIYMVTFGDLANLRAFSKKYGVDKYSNMHIGLDYENFFPTFYGATYVPFIVLYDKRKRFNGVFEGNTVEQLVKAVKYKP